MLVLLAVGCDRFGGAPLLSLDTDGGLLHLEVRSDPQPPEIGPSPFQYRVTDPEGAPVPDLVVTVVPFMPEMDMGPTVQPSVTDKGDGVYLVDDVDLVMEGRWELQTTFAGPVEDTASPGFDLKVSSR